MATRDNISNRSNDVLLRFTIDSHWKDRPQNDESIPAD